MTSNTPDRIWIESQAEEVVEGYGSWDCRNVYEYDVPYLLSNPARENAEELLEALEEAYKMLLGVSMDEASTENMLRFRAAIAKARGN